MPSFAQIVELVIECNWKWTSLNGINGWLVASKRNSNFIFLPAAGFLFDVGSPDFAGLYGQYWSRTLALDTDNPHDAEGLGFDSGGAYGVYDDRYYGLSVRAVRVSQN